MHFRGISNIPGIMYEYLQVLENMARVDRVLTMPGGSLLMAGRSGVGRRTAVSVVAHMHAMQVFTPKIGRGYGVKQFKNDLKTVSPDYTSDES